MDYLRLRICIDKIKITDYEELHLGLHWDSTGQSYEIIGLLRTPRQFRTFMDCFKLIQPVMFTIHIEGAG